MSSLAQKSANSTTGQGAAGYCRLDRYRVVTVSGRDAHAFLNRQVTCDLDAVTEERYGFGAWCTAKGRVITVLHIIRRPHGLCLLLPEDLLEDSLRRLRMFVLRDDVVFEPQTHDACMALGLMGQRALDGEPGASVLTAAEASHSVTHHGAVSCLHWPGSNGPRLILLGSRAALERRHPQAGQRRSQCTRNDWQLENIRAGIPDVYAATREAFIPQMLNLERIGGVSFSKGCYPGQEIVARTQHLGRIKRRMYIGRIQSCSAAPEPGANLINEMAEPVARIVSGAVNSDGGCELLAVVPLAKAGQALYLESPAVSDPCPVELQEPEYGFEVPP